MDETVKTDEDKYKMSNPYFAQFSANSLEGYSEILLWRAYNLLDYKIVHSAPFYIRVGGNTGFTRNMWRVSSAVTVSRSMQPTSIKGTSHYRMYAKTEIYAYNYS